MEFLLLPFFLFIPYILYFLYPVKFIKNFREVNEVLEPESFYIYSYAFHVHTQFSYDSLGKPEDVKKAREICGLDYVIVTDHEVDTFKLFEDKNTITGIEKKINDEKGKLQGDLIEVGDIKVISHHFKKKYRWKLERNKDYFFELINLKDSLVENKKHLFFYLFLGTFVYPVFKKSYLKNFVKVIKVEDYVKKYLSEGWENKVLGGLDHHVKVYIREVGIRFLFPSYTFSFRLLRNFLLSKKPARNKEEFLKALRSELNVISFSEKPSLFWVKNSTLFVYTPYPNVIIRIFSKDKVRTFLGSNLKFSLERGNYLVVGYIYSFRLWKFFFGVKPLFVSDLIKISC
ncbi:hypothetical protein [Aquifex aeolicus]|uniref:Polymerase/histidinol phosphatase N-terminal domain-containing protein n=1 Tax=Aquifex aeolicus (strain VF5) TaxID=224324 RepID=O67116_AQUAE|nr:hypothetical protein [Aquifex aeolicus]AAC07078.1 putative protein [Aquifex aeolicus VF5]